MADINSNQYDLEMVDVEDPEYSSSDDENGFHAIDSEYGEDSLHEQTLTPNVVTSKSSVTKSDFYRTSMKRQNICFGTSVFAVVGMFIAAYFYMDISFSPSNVGIFGDEKAMKGAAGEVGLDADNAETQQIIDQEIIELEETGHWGENAKDVRTKIDDIIFDKDRIGEHEWVTDSDWWKKNMENMNTHNMTKKELKAYKKMKKKAKRDKKKKDKDDKKKAKAAKKGKVPKTAKKEGHLEDIDDIKQKLADRHHSSHGEGRDKHKDSNIDDIYRIKQKHNGPRPDDWQRGKDKDEGDDTEEQQEPTKVPVDEADYAPKEDNGMLNKDDDDKKVQDDQAEAIDDNTSEEGEITVETYDQHEDEENEELDEQKDHEATDKIPDVTRNYDESEVPTEKTASVDITEELRDVETSAENNEQLDDEEEVVEEDEEQEEQDITAEISEESQNYDSKENESVEQLDDSEEVHEEGDDTEDGEEATEAAEEEDEEEEKEEIESSEILEDADESEGNASEEETDTAENSEQLEDAEDLADTNEEEESRSNTISTAYTVLEQDIHDKKSFTQGISYCSDGKIYETSGLYGQSKVRRINPDTFEVELSIDTPREFFGEGSTCFIGRDGKEYLIEITWKEQKGFIYDVPSLELLHSFDYRTTAPTNQGWGITYDPNKNELIVSDGSEFLYFWDVENFSTQRKVPVTRFDGTRQDQINELEFMDGLVCYNIWHQDDIICADPDTGKSVREYDFSGIWPANNRGSSENVLNGIALGKDHVLITGKRWDRIFKVDFTDWPTLFDNNN